MKKNIQNIRSYYIMHEIRIQKITLLLLYLCFFLWGIASYKDYGVSMDEPVQRKHGLVHLKYICELVNGSDEIPEYLKEIPDNLDTYTSKYYGIGIKIPLMLIEYLNGFQMSNQQIYYMNHLYTFMLFFLASIYVYKIAKKMKLGFWYSVLASVLFMICPRILADAFYNIKDSVFLSLFVVMLYYSLAVIDNFKIKDAIGLAVSAAFCLNTRIVGALPLFIACLVCVCKDGRIGIKRIRHILGTGLFSAAIYILITPASWGDVMGYVYHTVTVFSNYQHIGTWVLGNATVSSDNLPWYYTILCIFITMPNLYIVFSIIGIIAEIKKYINKREIKTGANILIFTILLQSVSVLLYDAIMRPIKYDMWRHFYFLFVYIVLFAVIGIRFAAENARKYCHTILAGVCGAIIFICGWIVINHPYEYSYFNYLLPANYTDEMFCDYWHVSGQDLLESIENDPNIDVYTNDCSNLYFGESEWERYHMNYEEKGAEYITDFDIKPKDVALYKEMNGIEVDNKKISHILERINYNNCLLKYFVSKDGIVTGYNSSEEIEWSFSEKEGRRSLKAEIPSDYQVYQMDFFASQKDRAVNVKAYGSYDGEHWNLYGNSVYVGHDMFSVISEDPMLPYFMIQFDERYAIEGVDYMIRVYGRKSSEISYIEGNYNNEDLKYAIDGDASTRWCSNVIQKAGMDIVFGLESERLVKGIRLDLGISLGDYPKELAIQYKNEEGNYMEIPYTTKDHEYYWFDVPQRCSEIRLLNKKNDDIFCWSIYEMDIKFGETYFWTYQDTRDIIENLEASSGMETAWKMIDNSLNTRWASDEPQNSNMFVDITLKPGNAIRGFHLNMGDIYLESARGIKIYGSYDADNWNEIPYEHGSASDYLFDEVSDYRYYRIQQIGEDDDSIWSIAELGILREE